MDMQRGAVAAKDAPFVQRLLEIVLVLAIVIVAVSPTWLGRGFFLDPLVIGVTALMPFIVGAWFLARGGKVLLASHLVTGALFVVAWYYMIARMSMTTNVIAVTALAFIPYVASILLGPRTTTAYALANIVVIAVLRVYAPWGGILDSEVFLFAFVFGGLTVATSALRSHDRREVAAGEEKLRTRAIQIQALLDSSHDARFVVDPAGRLTRWNEKGKTFLRSHGALRPGRKLADLLPDPLGASVAARLAAAGEGPQRWPATVDKDGDRIELDNSIWPMEAEGAPYEVVVTCRDITDRVLEAEQNILDVEEARTAILNLISHQLRTPLTPAIMEGHRLGSEQLGPLNEQQKKSLTRISRNVDRLSRLIDALLETSRVEAAYRDPPRIECDLRSVVEEALDDRGVRANVDPGGPARVLADPLGLRLAIGLLVTGASDHPLHVSFERVRSGCLVHMGCDGGIFDGVDPATDPLEPADEQDPSMFENALNMYIARNIIEANGGTIRKGEDAGKVIRLSVRLPGPSDPGTPRGLRVPAA